MDQRNTPTSGTRNRVHWVELLEDRWLLSGVSLPASPPDNSQGRVADVASTSHADASVTDESNTAPAGALEVVEFGVATEDDENEVPIATWQLPAEIVAAIDARFPGASLVEAELSSDDGSPVYEVNAEFDGQLIGMTLTPDGKILETERPVASHELPGLVLDWVRENFPGAAIDKADLVTESDALSYQLLIVTPGQQEFEATLRVQNADTPGASVRSNEQAGTRSDSVPITANGPAGLAGTNSLAEATAREASLESETRGQRESDDTATQPSMERGAAHDQTESRSADSSGAVAEADQPTATPDPTSAGDAASTSGDQHRPATLLAHAVRAVVETVASAGPIAWLPHVAGTLSDVLPIDVAAVEQGLEQLLDEIDSLAGNVADDTSVSNAALRVAVVAGLITGAELVILDSRKRRREPVLASNAASSSWSWVLGVAPPKRP